MSAIFPKPGNYIAGKCPFSTSPSWLHHAGHSHSRSGPPSGEGWVHEIKHDGYRTLIVIDQGNVRAFSHWGRDWTGPYRRVVDAGARLPSKAALIDREIVVQDENGVSDFEALRSAIHKARHRIVFFAFDLLHLDGQDLRRTLSWRAGIAEEADRA